MPLTHKVIVHLDLLHEPGAWVKVRMPSIAILDEAQQARLVQQAALLSKMDFSSLTNIQQAPDQDVSPPYDRLSLLRACILEWSYEDPVTPDNVAELDQLTADYIFSVLLGMDTQSGEQKKGSQNSTSPSKVVESLRKHG